MSDPLVLRQVHATRNRCRLRVESKLEREGIERLANALASFEGVQRAFVRPNTGSVILETALPVETVLAQAAAEGVVRIKPPLKPPPVGQALQMGLLKADMSVRKESDSAFDLRSLMALLLIAMAIVQLSRGRIAGPATTLLMSALSLLDLSKLPPTR